MNLYCLGPGMSPNPVILYEFGAMDVYALVPWMTPDPVKFIRFGSVDDPSVDTLWFRGYALVPFRLGPGMSRNPMN